MKTGKCLAAFGVILILLVQVAISSPGAIWNFRPTKSNSREFQQASAEASGNFLLAASNAFQMFGRVELSELDQANVAAGATIRYLSESQQRFVKVRAMENDMQILNSALKKVNYKAVEMSLGIPAAGQARKDWAALTSIAKSKGAVGTVDEAVSSMAALISATRSLLDPIRMGNVDSARKRTPGVFDLWQREITRGRYVSGIFQTTR